MHCNDMFERENSDKEDCLCLLQNKFEITDKGKSFHWSTSKLYQNVGDVQSTFGCEERNEEGEK